RDRVLERAQRCRVDEAHGHEELDTNHHPDERQEGAQGMTPQGWPRDVPQQPEHGPVAYRSGNRWVGSRRRCHEEPDATETSESTSTKVRLQWRDLPFRIGICSAII